MRQSAAAFRGGAESRRFSPLQRAGGLGFAITERFLELCRALRSFGFQIGPPRMVRALEAASAVDVINRHDVYWALHAVLVERPEQREIFDREFERVFDDRPEDLASGLPKLSLDDAAGSAMGQGTAGGTAFTSTEVTPSADAELERDAALSASALEVLQQKDFEAMSDEELRAARAAIARLPGPALQVLSRRLVVDPFGERIDLRASVRKSLRGNASPMPLVRMRRRLKPVPLVVVSDISGSMARYSSMLLHFAHSLMRHREQVSAFVFGTRLTAVSRELRERDVDAALALVSRRALDWNGGTRIGASLRTFNREWARRVLRPGAVVLLITDGLDRDAAEGLEAEMARLQRSCRRLIWLNPLLRYAGFEARAAGMRAMLPHVHEIRAVHNLHSLAALIDVLSELGAGPRSFA